MTVYILSLILYVNGVPSGTYTSHQASLAACEAKGPVEQEFFESKNPNVHVVYSCKSRNVPLVAAK